MYQSTRKFIIQKAVSTLFGHEPTTRVEDLKLVNSLVRRAEVLRVLELAFGAGLFVLLLGFNWKNRYVIHFPYSDNILTYCYSTEKA